MVAISDNIVVTIALFQYLLVTFSNQDFWLLKSENIRVFFKIDADIPDEQKEKLIRMAQKYSPVFNSIANPVPVSVQLDKK